MSEAAFCADFRETNHEMSAPPLEQRQVDAITNSSVRDEPAVSQRPRSTFPLPLIENAAVVSAQPSEPIEYDIELIAPARDAPILMFGPPASLKSWLALGICDAVVRGVPFAGLKTRQRPRALYLNLDAGATSFRNRVRMISDAPGLDFISLSASAYTNGTLRSVLEQYRGAYVVIDCLSAIFAPEARMDPTRAMRSFVDGLRAIYAEHNCGGLIIDHPHRPKERGELGDYHGSIQKEAAFRTMWSVVAEAPANGETERRIKIACRKMSEGASFAPITVDLKFGDRVTVSRLSAADSSETVASIVEMKILEWARVQTTPFSRRNVEDRVRGHATTLVREGFKNLVAKGRIETTGATRGGGGLYQFVAPGLTATASETHSDEADAVKIVSAGPSASRPLCSIGDALVPTHSATHSRAITTVDAA